MLNSLNLLSTQSWLDASYLVCVWTPMMPIKQWKIRLASSDRKYLNNSLPSLIKCLMRLKLKVSCCVIIQFIVFVYKIDVYGTAESVVLIEFTHGHYSHR